MVKLYKIKNHHGAVFVAIRFNETDHPKWKLRSLYGRLMANLLEAILKITLTIFINVTCVFRRSRYTSFLCAVRKGHLQVYHMTGAYNCICRSSRHLIGYYIRMRSVSGRSAERRP